MPTVRWVPAADCVLPEEHDLTVEKPWSWLLDALLWIPLEGQGYIFFLGDRCACPRRSSAGSWDHEARKGTEHSGEEDAFI